VFFSAAAALINWRAFLAYSVAKRAVVHIVLIIAGAMLFGGQCPAGQRLWTLQPVWFASSYLSHRDVFEADGADSAGEEPPNTCNSAMKNLTCWHTARDAGIHRRRAKLLKRAAGECRCTTALLSQLWEFNR
jgi:hypothetical protein